MCSTPRASTSIQSSNNQVSALSGKLKPLGFLLRVGLVDIIRWPGWHGKTRVVWALGQPSEEWQECPPWPMQSQPHHMFPKKTKTQMEEEGSVITKRENTPIRAWKLLQSQRGPLVPGCFSTMWMQLRYLRPWPWCTITAMDGTSKLH